MFLLHFPKKIYDAVLADPTVAEQDRFRTFVLRNSLFNFLVLMILCVAVAALWGVLQWQRLLGVSVLCAAGSVFDSVRQYTVLSSRR